MRFGKKEYAWVAVWTVGTVLVVLGVGPAVLEFMSRPAQAGTEAKIRVEPVDAEPLPEEWAKVISVPGIIFYQHADFGGEDLPIAFHDIGSGEVVTIRDEWRNRISSLRYNLGPNSVTLSNAKAGGGRQLRLSGAGQIPHCSNYRIGNDRVRSMLWIRGEAYSATRR